MKEPRKTCPVCKCPVKKWNMFTDYNVFRDEEWEPPEVTDLLVNLDPDDLESCRYEEDDVNIDICPRCETAFS